MFREMRRKKQQLSKKECLELLARNTSGVLAVLGDDDYPYAVPLSFVADDDKIYFHCAQSGHKLDAIKRHSKASFCVIDQDQIIPGEYTTYYRSVIVFGRMRMIEDTEEKRTAIEKLAIKYAPSDSDAGRRQAIDREWASLCVLEMKVEHMSGKEAIELIQKRQRPN